MVENTSERKTPWGLSLLNKWDSGSENGEESMCSRRHMRLKWISISDMRNNSLCYPCFSPLSHISFMLQWHNFLWSLNLLHSFRFHCLCLYGVLCLILTLFSWEIPVYSSWSRFSLLLYASKRNITLSHSFFNS